jgi:hypothetical protein
MAVRIVLFSGVTQATTIRTVEKQCRQNEVYEQLPQP